jgi:hypothetical protein
MLGLASRTRQRLVPFRRTTFGDVGAAIEQPGLLRQRVRYPIERLAHGVSTSLAAIETIDAWHAINRLTRRVRTSGRRHGLLPQPNLRANWTLESRLVGWSNTSRSGRSFE